MRRILGIVAVSLVVLAAAGAGALYWLLSGDGIRRALERQAGAWLGQPVTIASARVALWPRAALALRDVGVGSPVRLRLAEVDVAASPMALLRRRVEDAELRVRSTRLDLPLALQIPTATPGGAGGAASAAGDGATADDDGFRIVSVGAIVLEDVVVASRGRELTIAAESSLVESRLLVRELTVRSGSTSIRATGAVALEPRVDADLQVTANQLDVDELLALAAAFLPAQTDGGAAEAGRGDGPRLKAAVTAAAARAAGVEASRFATTMIVDGGRVALSPLTFELFGGRYDGAIQARMGPQVGAEVRAAVDGIDVARLAAFAGSPDTVAGRLSGEASVSGAGPDLSAVLASARGNGRASITSGTMRRLGLVRTIVLFFGRPEADAPPSTDQFERLDARFALAGGRLHAEDLELRAADFDGVGTGTLDLKARTLNGRISVTLSEALSRQAGTDLRRYTREGDRIVLPITVGGTLGEPRVNVDAAAALQRGLRNEAERRLKGILDRFK